jgi:hypothetical protein
LNGRFYGSQGGFTSIYLRDAAVITMLWSSFISATGADYDNRVGPFFANDDRSGQRIKPHRYGTIDPRASGHGWSSITSRLNIIDGVHPQV